MTTITRMICFVTALGALAARAAYIPLTFTNPALPATGSFLVSVWVRPTGPAMSNTVVNLVVRETKNGKAKDRILNYARLADGQWTRLSAWLYPGKKALPRERLMVSAANTAQVELTGLELRVAGGALPPFTKGFVRVNGRALTNNLGLLLLRGVNITAYTDSKKDEPGQVLARVCPRDYQQIAARGFNAVRLTCWHDGMQRAGGWEWLDVHIALARQHGLYIVLDMHAPPGGYQGPSYKGPFWKNTALQEQLVAWWRAVAQRYKNEPVIASYDLLNEPKPGSAQQWYAYAQRLVNTIRAEGDTHAIVVETDMTSGDVWSAISDPAIIYDTHWYEPWDFVAQRADRPFGAYGEQHVIYGDTVVLNKEWLRLQMQAYVQWCQSRNVPMQAGEYGVTRYALAPALKGMDWLRDSCELFDEYQMSRFYWSWYPFEFGLNYGWYRRDPGDFHVAAAAVAAGVAH